MVVKLKLYFSLAFTGIFVINQLSAVWLSLALHIHKEKFQAASAMTLIPFSQAELESAPSFRWIEPGVEFTINNKMYDVKSTEILNGAKIYRCKYDPHELKILKRLKKSFRELNNQTQTGKQNSSGFLNITTLFCQEIQLLRNFSQPTIQENSYWYLLVLLHYVGSPDFPPPKYIF